MSKDFDKWEERAKENTDKIMSKEQTPIEKRAEWIAKRVDISEHAKMLIMFQIKEAVLEALERVTEEEIELKIDSIPYYGTCTAEYKEGFREGIEWYKEKTKQK